MTLFSDIFGLIEHADELAEMDFMYGEKTSNIIIEIYNELSKQFGG